MYAANYGRFISRTESLAENLSGAGVSVTALCPGATATNMVSTAQQKSGGFNLTSSVIGEVEQVAAQGYRVCLKGDVICVPRTVSLAATHNGQSHVEMVIASYLRRNGAL